MSQSTNNDKAHQQQYNQNNNTNCTFYNVPERYDQIKPQQNIKNEMNLQIVSSNQQDFVTKDQAIYALKVFQKKFEQQDNAIYQLQQSVKKSDEDKQEQAKKYEKIEKQFQQTETLKNYYKNDNEQLQKKVKQLEEKDQKRSAFSKLFD